jgi:hypothetical protein
MYGESYSVLFTQLYRHCIGGIVSSTMWLSTLNSPHDFNKWSIYIENNNRKQLHKTAFLYTVNIKVRNNIHQCTALRIWELKIFNFDWNMSRIKRKLHYDIFAFIIVSHLVLLLFYYFSILGMYINSAYNICFFRYNFPAM